MVLLLPTADTESFVRGGPITSTFFSGFFLSFIVDGKGGEDPNTTNSGPSSAQQ